MANLRNVGDQFLLKANIISDKSKRMGSGILKRNHSTAKVNKRVGVL
jgi:hypothetical protein